MKIQKICMLGGTGFVGRHLTARLANQGYKIKVLTRHPQRHREMELCPGVELAGADVHDPKVLRDHFAGCDAVINLIGVLHQFSGQSFRAVHAELPGKVVEACQAAGVQRLLHMSALHADAAKGPSQYLFTKGEGERVVMQAQNLAVTCFKPSVIFAPDDDFFNKFAGLLKLFPVLPLACPNARFAPVYVGDVVRAFETALTDTAAIGKSYELCGPRIYTLKELVENIRAMLGRTCPPVMGLPDSLARLQGKIFDKLPIKVFTTDNFLSLQVDSVCSRNGLEELGITPRSVESIMPMYFASKTQRGQYDTFRRAARRD